MKSFILAGLIAINTSFWVTDTFGANLVDVYKQAVLCDPVYQSAREQFLAETQAYPQARSRLLPNLTADGLYSYTHERFYSLNFGPTSTAATLGITPTINYTTAEYTITLTQPIINVANWEAVSVAKAQVAQAEATYISAWQNLVLRVANAYFNVLQAEDTVRYDQAQKRAIYEQYRQEVERYNVGMSAITALLNARASYDLVVAREISDKNAVVIAREQLRQITGVYYENLDTLKVRFPLLSPEPINIEDWVHAAEDGNPTIQAAHFGAIAAHYVIKQNHAGHLPTLNAVATYDRTKPSQITIVSLSTMTERAELQLNVPIYQGGLVVANTRQAIFNYEKSLYDLENAHRQVVTNTRQAYYTVMSNISKVMADRQAIISNQASVHSTQAALSAGTRTVVDLLNAQQNLYQAQTTLAADQYAYFNQTLNLKLQAGILSCADLAKIDRWLAPPVRMAHQPPSSLPLPTVKDNIKEVKQIRPASNTSLRTQGLQDPKRNDP